MNEGNIAISGYQLSRNWFDWCFENPEKIKTNHTALYFFIIEHCNRLGWKDKFGLPSSMCKDAIGIKSYNTYIDTLNDLVEWGFIIIIEKSRNQYSSNIVSINRALLKNNKAFNRALIEHAKNHDKNSPINCPIKKSESTIESSTETSIESTIESTSSIVKQEEPLNLKTKNTNFVFSDFKVDIFQDIEFRDALITSKKGKSSKHQYLEYLNKFIEREDPATKCTATYLKVRLHFENWFIQQMTFLDKINPPKLDGDGSPIDFQLDSAINNLKNDFTYLSSFQKTLKNYKYDLSLLCYRQSIAVYRYKLGDFDWVVTGCNENDFYLTLQYPESRERYFERFPVDNKTKEELLKRLTLRQSLSKDMNIKIQSHLKAISDGAELPYQ
jgi:hypothetical protein